jgi:hypothetical protein
MLNNFRTILAKVKVKFQKTDGIEFGNIEVKAFTLLCKVAYNHAQVKESPAYEMLLLVNLNFHDKPSTCSIFAIDIKYGFAVKLCFPKLLIMLTSLIGHRSFSARNVLSRNKSLSELCSSAKAFLTTLEEY